MIYYQKNYVDEILVNVNEEQHKRVIEDSSGNVPSASGEYPIEMHFYDGLAITTDDSGIIMRYPSLADIKQDPRRMNEIIAYTDREDIMQYDVALKYGQLDKYKMVADYNIWVMQGENDKKDITAIHDRKGNFLFDVLEEDYRAMFNKGMVDCGNLTRNFNKREISELRMKHGILWTEHITDDITKSE